ncbi:hypothetical protein BLNAU_3434 [Blattamonas nauphoetae]|uniref:Uncharacterized protein n=1 Tax=Blattamonas nauphoetae TaxID=2049346 RepID=A0ABQ9YCZ3_9EUKA|nr:hypothetical protein BLNAU_3434 [Blattamonas nauphoetae]
MKPSASDVLIHFPSCSSLPIASSPSNRRHGQHRTFGGQVRQHLKQQVRNSSMHNKLISRVTARINTSDGPKMDLVDNDNANSDVNPLLSIASISSLANGSSGSPTSARRTYGLAFELSADSVIDTCCDAAIWKKGPIVSIDTFSRVECTRLAKHRS